MLVLICVSGLESAGFVRRVLSRTGVSDLHAALLYVIDQRPPHEIGYVRRVGGVGSEAEEMATALEVLDEAVGALGLAGVPPSRARRFIARGRPQELIVAHAIDLGVDLVAIGSRHRGALQTMPPVGPPPIGPVARHVLDHAPCDVLLLR